MSTPVRPGTSHWRFSLTAAESNGSRAGRHRLLGRLRTGPGGRGAQRRRGGRAVLTVRRGRQGCRMGGARRPRHHRAHRCDHQLPGQAHRLLGLAGHLHRQWSGPGFAFAAGFSLLLGYIGFAITGTLGGVLYLDSFLESIGLGSQAAWFKLLLVIVIVAVAVVSAVSGCRPGGQVRVGVRADRDRVDSRDHRRCVHLLRLPDRHGAVEISRISAQAPPSSRR